MPLRFGTRSWFGLAILVTGIGVRFSIADDGITASASVVLAVLGITLMVRSGGKGTSRSDGTPGR